MKLDDVIMLRQQWQEMVSMAENEGITADLRVRRNVMAYTTSCGEWLDSERGAGKVGIRFEEQLLWGLCR